MQETKFILHGQFHRSNGWVMNDSLGYIKLTNHRKVIMRIFFLTLFVILGANLMIDLLDSSMVKIIQERNETLQRSLDSM
jgi:hypothetical protein